MKAHLYRQRFAGTYEISLDELEKAAGAVGVATVATRASLPPREYELDVLSGNIVALVTRCRESYVGLNTVRMSS